MATVYYDKDADFNLLKGKKIAMLGYGVNAVIYKIAAEDIDAVSLVLVTTVTMTVVSLIAWLLFKE